MKFPPSSNYCAIHSVHLTYTPRTHWRISSAFSRLSTINSANLLGDTDQICIQTANGMDEKDMSGEFENKKDFSEMSEDWKTRKMKREFLEKQKKQISLPSLQKP